MGTLRLAGNAAYGSENNLVEALITEAVNMHGDDFFYVPRTLVNKDEILGEDRLSEFRTKHPIVMYLESVNGYEGQGAMLSKFGLAMDQQATLTVSRRTWEEAVGVHDTTILPNRPAEGDLIFYPRTNALLEIMFVAHENPFYQIGNLYVYRLTVEKFRYSSEHIVTGEAGIDAFMGLSIETSENVEIPQSFGDNEKFKTKAAGFVFSTDNPFGDL